MGIPPQSGHDGLSGYWFGLLELASGIDLARHKGLPSVKIGPQPQIRAPLIKGSFKGELKERGVLLALSGYIRHSLRLV